MHGSASYRRTERKEKWLPSPTEPNSDAAKQRATIYRMNPTVGLQFPFNERAGLLCMPFDN